MIGFFDSWVAHRLWPVDMAGFAVSLEYLERSPNATMPYKAGLEEDGFLKSIGLKMNEIEPKAKNCTEVLVWHTQTKKEKPAEIQIDSRVMDTNDTSLGSLLRSLQGMGVSHTSPTSGKFSQQHKTTNQTKTIQTNSFHEAEITLTHFKHLFNSNKFISFLFLSFK